MQFLIGRSVEDKRSLQNEGQREQERESRENTQRQHTKNRKGPITWSIKTSGSGISILSRYGQIFDRVFSHVASYFLSLCVVLILFPSLAGFFSIGCSFFFHVCPVIWKKPHKIQKKRCIGNIWSRSRFVGKKKSRTQRMSKAPCRAQLNNKPSDYYQIWQRQKLNENVCQPYELK